jgi:hypothetical protein
MQTGMHKALQKRRLMVNRLPPRLQIVMQTGMYMLTLQERSPRTWWPGAGAMDCI